MNGLYAKYLGRVAFYVVYIQEAHTSDLWQDPDNIEDHIVFVSPSSFAQRVEMGEMCVVKLGIKFPAVVDSFDNSTERAYTGWPDRLYVIDKDGRVRYKSDAGPFGFKPQGVADTLQKLIPAGSN